MLNKYRTSIANRLLLVLFLVSILTASLIGFLYYQYTIQKEYNDSEKSLHQLIFALSKSAAIAAYLEDITLAEEVVGGIAANDLVMAVQLRSGNMSLAKRGDINSLDKGTIDYKLESPFLSDIYVGDLIVVPDVTVIRADAKKAAINHVLLISVQTVVLMLFIAIMLNKQLLAEIKRMANGLHKIRIGSFERLNIAPSHQYDELGSLTNDINTLLISAQENFERERQLRLEVQELEKRFRGIFEQSSHGIAITNQLGSLQLHNPSFANIIGKHKLSQLMKDKSLSLFSVFGSEKQKIESAAALAIQTSQPQAVELRSENEGESRWLYCLISKMQGSASGQSSLEISLQDISERRAREELLKDQAELDALTKLFNRRAGESKIQQIINSVDKRRNTYAMFMIDLDGFKPVNDQYGHEAGDAVLIILADRLTECVRTEDIVMRWGGDEFVIFAKLNTNVSEASHIAQKLLDVINSPMECDLGKTFQVSASIGISLYPFNSDNMDTLVKYADAAMYQTKVESKNGYNYYSEPLSLDEDETLIHGV